MKVKCVVESNVNKKYLTLFRKYEVIEELPNQYKIKDNSGEINLYGKDFFEIESDS